eukprot:5361528-Pyramimonas_sp.AAC.1
MSECTEQPQSIRLLIYTRPHPKLPPPRSHPPPPPLPPPSPPPVPPHPPPPTPRERLGPSSAGRAGSTYHYK